MHYAKFVLILITGCINQVPVSSQLPSTCRFEHVSSTRLTCSSAYIFPRTFAVEQIPTNVTFLSIGINNGYSWLKDNFVPIPPRVRLVEVTLTSLTYHNGSSVPVDKFLVNVKHQLTILFLINCPLYALDANFFKGFSALQRLQLTDTHLRSISKGTFSQLQLYSVTPKLSTVTHLDLTNNPSDNLDWATFSPMAKSLLELKVQNSCRSVNNSENFTLEKINSINIENNKLTLVPTEVLNTINQATIQTFYLNGNSFCPSSIMCSCCEIENLTRWIWNTESISRLSYRFACGSGARCPTEWDSWEDLVSAAFCWFHSANCSLNWPSGYQNIKPPPLDQYAKCSTARDPIDSTFLCVQTPSVGDHNQVEGSQSTVVPVIVTDTTQQLIVTSTTVITSTASPVDPDDTLTIKCSKGNLTISETDPESLDATSAVMTIDNTLKCRTKMFELHNLVLEDATETANRDRASSPAPIFLDCKKGSLTVSANDPDSSEATSIILNGDGTRKCRQKVYDLQTWALNAGATRETAA